jgi:PII-like signaling protein
MNSRERLHILIEEAAKHKDDPPDWAIVKRVQQQKENDLKKNYQLYDR